MNIDCEYVLPNVPIASYDIWMKSIDRDDSSVDLNMIASIVLSGI